MAKIRTIELANGEKRYEITVDIGRDPDTGKRQHTRRRYLLQREAKAELARIGHQARTGTYIRPWDGTVNELLDSYLRSATFEKEENTKVSYRDALRLPRERLGHRKAQSVIREDIEALRDYALEFGRKRGGPAGSGLSSRSVRLMLQQVRAAFEQGCDDGRLTRNPCRKVTPPRLVKAERDTWSEAEVKRFLATSDADRLAAAWRLTLYGMRRAEVCGLRWCDVDLKGGTLTIVNTRVSAGYKPIDKAPKSRKGLRTLPLDAGLISALPALQSAQGAELLEAADAYESSGYVVTDELGRPVHPEWFTDEFHRVRERAGLRRITLHDGRHTANSLMAAAGVPGHIRAAWCGHTVAVNETTYTHARPEDLAAAMDVLSKISKVV